MNTFVASHSYFCFAFFFFEAKSWFYLLKVGTVFCVSLFWLVWFDLFLRSTLFATLRPNSFVVVESLSCIQLFATLWTAAQQASLSFIISRHHAIHSIPRTYSSYNWKGWVGVGVCHPLHPRTYSSYNWKGCVCVCVCVRAWNRPG